MAEVSAIYSRWWGALNDTFEIRIRFGRPIHRLRLVGNWIKSDRIRTDIMDVDRAALKRARTLFTEVIDERAFPAV